MAEANTDTIYQEANQLVATGDLAGGAAKLEELLGLDDSHVLAHLTLAKLLGQLGRHEDAVRHGERACELDSTDPLNFTILSVVYQRALAATGDMRLMQAAELARDRANQMSQSRRG